MKQSNTTGPLWLWTWDGLFPLLGLALNWYLMRYSKISSEQTELIFLMAVPIAWALIRVGLGSQETRGAGFQQAAAWRKMVHQFFFALAILTLMLFEAMVYLVNNEGTIGFKGWVLTSAVFVVYLVWIGFSRLAIPINFSENNGRKEEGITGDTQEDNDETK